MTPTEPPIEPPLLPGDSSSMPSESLESQAFELRGQLSHWFARRGVPAVAEVVGPVHRPELQVRATRPDGSLEPGQPWDSFLVRGSDVGDQMKQILRELSRTSWWEASVTAPIRASTALWCAPV